MAKSTLTDEEVKAEIAKLSKSPFVKIARQSQRDRQYLYTLRYLDKLGRQIVEEAQDEEEEE